MLDSEETARLAKGQLLLLTRCATWSDVEMLQRIGYRFAKIPQIIDGLVHALKVDKDDLTMTLGRVRSAAWEPKLYEAGVHVLCFAMRPLWQMSSDILAQKDASHLLPIIRLSLSELNPHHLDLLQELEGKNVGYCLLNLSSDFLSMPRTGSCCG